MIALLWMGSGPGLTTLGHILPWCSAVLTIYKVPRPHPCQAPGKTCDNPHALQDEHISHPSTRCSTKLIQLSLFLTHSLLLGSA